ncbi:hypothetical protein ILUMI_13642 [Ignelater luminosus]|uniref:Pre-C2HC domain-containing protein n=1 Tax=Ignelater luminosus TaxID=2038154 RepID=A0A8K0G8G7_IGNLU|nr:hypothetical protein ILUMI_13642 [Ignelater luminosus]
MVATLTQVAGEETYHTRATANNAVKVDPYTPDTYRKIVRHLCEKKIVYYTYQLKQERAYRVVRRDLHHSIPLEEIKELKSKGHTSMVILKYTVTKSYDCIKCGKPHESKTCKKTRDSPATFILYNGNHTANYKGCSVYRNLVTLRTKSTKSASNHATQRPPVNTTINQQQIILSSRQDILLSYAYPTPIAGRKFDTK